MNSTIGNFVDLFSFAANGIVVVSILVSWFPRMAQWPGVDSVMGMAEVILWPARRLFPPKGALDWSPLVTIVGLQLLQGFIHSLL